MVLGSPRDEPDVLRMFQAHVAFERKPKTRVDRKSEVEGLYHREVFRDSRSWRIEFTVQVETHENRATTLQSASVNSIESVNYSESCMSQAKPMLVCPRDRRS